MDLNDVISRVDQILIDEFELDEAQVVPAAVLREDLDLDSLDALDLIVLLEKEFQVTVNEDELLTLTTVSDVHEYVRQLFSKAEHDA